MTEHYLSMWEAKKRARRGSYQNVTYTMLFRTDCKKTTLYRTWTARLYAYSREPYIRLGEILGTHKHEGDEPFDYRKASLMYATAERPAFDYRYS